MGRDKVKPGDKKDEKKGGKEEKKGGKEEKKGGKDAKEEKKDEKEEKKEETEVAAPKREKREKGKARKMAVTRAIIKPKNIQRTDKPKSLPMRKIRIEKLIVNICVGESGDRLTKANRVLKELTDQEPVFSVARLTVRTFGIRRNEKIACHVTVREESRRNLKQRTCCVRIRNEGEKLQYLW